MKRKTSNKLNVKPKTSFVFFFVNIAFSYITRAVILFLLKWFKAQFYTSKVRSNEVKLHQN